MKKALILACVLGALGSQLSAETTNDIAYYPDDFPVSGDRKYANERCKLDVYGPGGLPEGAPVVVWFHGGGLSAGNRHIPAEFRDQKFLVVPVNYRLFPRAKCVEANALLAAMLRRTKENWVEFHSYPRTNHGSCGPPSRAYIQAELNKMAGATAPE